MALNGAPETASLRKATKWGAALTAFLGLLFWVVGTFDEKHAGANFKRLHYISYDALSLIRPTVEITNVLIVAMDEDSYENLKQKSGELWDRALHARLLDIVFARGARMVIFDIVFAGDWPDRKVDEYLEAALKHAQGKVILAESQRQFEEIGEIGGSRENLRPLERFAAIAPVGVAEVPKDADGTVRRYPTYPQTHLARKAAETLGIDVPGDEQHRWINYYGPPGTIRPVSYFKVLQPDDLPPDIFSNKVVFVGKHRVITARGASRGDDEFPTPLTRWTGYWHSGVEIQATIFANLLRRDWQQQLPWFLEVLSFIAFGVLFGFGLTRARPLPALGWAVAGAVLVAGGALVLFSVQRIWFPWLIVVGAQIPFALAWSEISYLQRAARGKDIPDHTLLRCVGRGGYGEVWLARDSIGGYHAVKIVYRKKFAKPAPYEREFRGITHFAPLSRSHPGLVHILHVGRNDLRGCFYCIMEAADDEMNGTKIQPDRYEPKSLAGEVARRGRLPVRECVQLALDLASALEFLHQKKLIHRDIKPANIIFVNGQPKLADVGLVTALSDEGVTLVGTTGYVPPEGPGTAAADVYALGKTLYEAATATPCTQFPELPTDLSAGADADALLRLHEILLTACETDPANRYATAAGMRADLLALQGALGKPSVRSP